VAQRVLNKNVELAAQAVQKFNQHVDAAGLLLALLGGFFAQQAGAFGKFFKQPQRARADEAAFLDPGCILDPLQRALVS